MIQEGLSKVIPQAERSPHGRTLFSVEEKAREAKKNIWESYVAPTVEEEEKEQEDEDEEAAEVDSKDAPATTPTAEEKKSKYQEVGSLESCLLQAFVVCGLIIILEELITKPNFGGYCLHKSIYEERKCFDECIIKRKVKSV